MHVGADATLPEMLVESIHRTNPDSRVIQCSDETTPPVQGVAEIFRLALHPKGLMSTRLQAFAALGLTDPAIYLDTDMLVVRRVEPTESLGGKSAMFCGRSFDWFSKFNNALWEDDFPEYSGLLMSEVFPLIACCTVSRNHELWAELLELLTPMDDRFHRWFGDQAAMKLWVRNRPRSEWGLLPEAVWGCLPEKGSALNQAKILHFKGPNRKPVMKKSFDAIFGHARPGPRDAFPIFYTAWRQAYLGDEFVVARPASKEGKAPSLPWQLQAR